MFGPPRYCWCFRYESKNAPLKKVMRRICNFKNVPYSLAFNCQQKAGLDAVTDGQTDFFGLGTLNCKVISMKKTHKHF